MTKKIGFSCLLIFAALFVCVLAVAEDPPVEVVYDRSESDGCYDCHMNPTQGWVVENWRESAHANSLEAGHTDNAYCGKCHSPFEGDPAATHDDRTPFSDPTVNVVPQGVTCGSCHPDHHVRVAAGSPIGNYVVGSENEVNDYDPDVMGLWEIRHEGEENDLCTYCHTGSRHTPSPRMAEMAFVKCIDCHMPETPVEYQAVDEETGQLIFDANGDPIMRVKLTRAHDFGFDLEDEVALAAKANYSCGTDGAGCHSQEPTEWAVAAILSGIIHDDAPDVDPGGPYTGYVNQDVQFAAVASDPEGAELLYTWDFGDGTVVGPSTNPSAVHAYAQAGVYSGVLTVSDGQNEEEEDFDVTIDFDTWSIQIPVYAASLTVTFEEFGGFQLVKTTHPDGQVTYAIGWEFSGVIVWMDTSGAIFFGSINRDAGTASGIVLNYAGGTSIWLGAQL